MTLHPAERTCAYIIATLFLVDALLIPIRQVGVDWVNYELMIGIGTFAVLAGQFYRSVRKEERIALAATSSGLFILFTIAGSTFNYLLLPVGDRRIDLTLANLDAKLGYNWADFVSYVSTIPMMGEVLRWIYASSIPQLIAVVLILGFSGERERLHRFLLTGIIGALFSVGIWVALPSSGPAAFEVIPAEVAQSFNMMVGNSYGAELNRLALEGPTFLSPNDTLGLIAFPSFHTVMACMAVWFMYRTPFAFPVFLLINLLIIPAILAHGGHHFVDVVGGFLVFGLALFASKHIIMSAPKGHLSIHVHRAK